MKSSARQSLRPGKAVRRTFVERAAAGGPGAGEKLEWLPESHVIKNVCMLSPESRNGRTYTKEALADAVRMYDGARAYVDHPDDPREHRSTRDRIGRWHNARIEGGKVRGDLHYDPNHPYARSLVWAVQHCPDHCGISHNVEAEGVESEDGHFTVTKLADVRSVDIVDDPATNKSLLESHRPRTGRHKRRPAREANVDPEYDNELPGGEGGGSPQEKLGEYIMACLDDPNIDKATKRKHILKALDLHDGHDEAGAAEEEEDDLHGHGDEHDEGELDRVSDDEEEGGDEGRDLELGKPRERDDEDEEEIEESGSDEIRGRNQDAQKRAMWAKDPDNPYSESYQAVKNLTRSRKPGVRDLAERLLRKLPAPRRVVRRPTRPRGVVPIREGADDAAALANHPDPVVRRAMKRLDALEAQQIVRTTIAKVLAECKAARLPKRLMSRLFVEQLADEEDPRRRKAMIHERAHIASIELPRSYGAGGPGGGPPRISNREFVEMVNGNVG